jgi:hypothetical protein
VIATSSSRSSLNEPVWIATDAVGDVGAQAGDPGGVRRCLRSSLRTARRVLHQGAVASRLPDPLSAPQPVIALNAGLLIVPAQAASGPEHSFVIQEF